jgi:hypothetical protein
MTLKPCSSPQGKIFTFSFRTILNDDLTYLHPYNKGKTVNKSLKKKLFSGFFEKKLHSEPLVFFVACERNLIKIWLKLFFFWGNFS